MKKYLLLAIALSTPHILFADQGTNISPLESARQIKVAAQGNQKFSFVDVLIGRIKDNPKLSKSFKEACPSCDEGTLSSFKARSLPPEQMRQVANAVTAFAQQSNIAPEMKYFQKN